MSILVFVRYWSGILLLLLLLNCGGSRTLYDYDTKVRFYDYATYSWLEPAGGAPQVIPPIDEAIKMAVDRQLEGKGLRMVDGEGDFIVSYYVGSKAPIDTTPNEYTYWPGRWSYGGYYGGAEPFIFPKGALIIDLIDRRHSQLAWRGSTYKVISNAAVEKQTTRINEATEEILIFFPPRIYE